MLIIKLKSVLKGIIKIALNGLNINILTNL
jgi:hypothetical protein